MSEEILGVIRKTLGLKELDQNARIEQVILDSIDIIELIAVLSNKYRIDVKPDDLKGINTFSDIVKYVVRKQGTRPPGTSLETF